MIDIVNELVEIECVANEILVSAENDKLILNEVSNLIKSELNKKIDELTKIEIDNIKKSDLILKNERLEQISSGYNNFISEMKNDFDSKKNDWVNDIFNSLLEDY